MQILHSEKHLFELFSILTFITLYKPDASKNFLSRLDYKINQLPLFPYKHRKSIYFENDNIRDLIFIDYMII